MLPGKGKHGLKRSGKGSKESGGKVMPSGSKTKETPHTPPLKVKTEPEEVRESPPGLPIIRTVDNARVLPRYTTGNTKPIDNLVSLIKRNKMDLCVRLVQ